MQAHMEHLLVTSLRSASEKSTSRPNARYTFIQYYSFIHVVILILGIYYIVQLYIYFN